MNLKHLNDETLHADSHRLNREHNEILTALLHHLRENERRRLFSKYKYDSLFAYCIGEFKYSEGETNRRISAMRLLRDIPEIEERITSGELSLTNLALAQTLFSKEKKSGRAMNREQKVKVLAKLENQSTRAAQKIVSTISPTFKKPELSFSNIEDDVLREKLLKLKGQMAHKHPNLTLIELLHKICDAQLEGGKKKSPSAQEVKKQSTAEIIRQVWARDNFCCSNCGSTHAVQVDHRIPQAVGGETSLENVRLLCRNCNQRAAIEFFGVSKMDSFLN